MKSNYAISADSEVLTVEIASASGGRTVGKSASGGSEALREVERYRHVPGSAGLRAIKVFLEEALVTRMEGSPLFPVRTPVAGDLLGFRQRSTDPGNSSHTARLSEAMI